MDNLQTVMGLTFFPQQWCAVTAPVGPVLVLAGPGAGKTRCLTGRIGYLLAHHNADPQRICAITFTNKAAQEIADRLRHGLGDLVEALKLGTIHALCLEFLREHGRRLGLPSGFGVADDEHQRLVLARLGVPSKRHGQLLLLFGRRRLQGHTLSQQDEALFGRYQRELRSNHLIDFDEILQLTHLLLRDTPAILDGYRGRWDHVLIDECQDLDATQYAILKLLADSHRSLFAVGDDEQSIFSWRGADPRVLARFVTDFGIDEPIVLDVNCRCARGIFDAARRILPSAQPLFEKKITAIRESSFNVRAIGFADETEEAPWILDDLRQEIATGLRPGDCAVLYRTHQAGRVFEEALVAAGIPCRLARGQSLSDDKVIARVLAALRVVANPDADLHVESLAAKVFSEPLLAEIKRRPGATFLARLRINAEQTHGPDAGRCWRFLYQAENLKGLGRLQGDLHGLVQAVLAQGIGEYEGPLEARHERLDDPEALPSAVALAETLLAVEQRRGRILLAPAGGLEIVARVMIRSVLRGLTVEHLRAAGAALPGDRVFWKPTGPGPWPFSPGEERLQSVVLIKALQIIEGRRYRKGLTDYVVFDTETTGKDVQHAEVIELAAVRVRGGRVVDTFQSLVSCTKPIPPGATAVHGYTDADLRGQPALSEVWPRFRAFAGDDVLVVHNGRQYDVPLLERLTAGWGGTEGMFFFDTLPLARSLFPAGSLRLVDLAARFGVDTGRGHHALDDSLCLVGVFEHLQEERLRRWRKTCLAELLDCVALGAAIEGRTDLHPEDQAFVEAARWSELRRPPAVVDAYTEEAERFGLHCPSLDELLGRMGTPGWKGGRGDPAGHERPAESHARLSRVVALVKTAPLDEAVRALLDKVALSTSEGASVDPERVSLLTFHSTKGLEFGRVYIVGVEDFQLPGYYAMTEKRAEDIHEARRLLYVAMTRAKDRLTLTWCKERAGKPTGGTMFLDEMGLTQGKA
ncbi:MAG TPA: UvrD-helicase domain-containing protein [Gemmataceae bacterium]|nr:UvrD-helicase domain-containing protein [Gemmataceae bacterium]